MIAVKVDNAPEVAAALERIARECPALFEKALRMECRNVQRSIAATLRNYRITKYEFDPSLKGGAGAWRAKALAPRHVVTKALHGKKGGGVLADPHRIALRTVARGTMEIGHVGGLAAYASQWQEGGPVRALYTPTARHALYRRLGARFDVHDTDALAALLTPAPARHYIGAIAEKTGRDFAPGLAAVLEKIADGRLKAAARK